MTMGERPPVYPAAMSTLAETTTGPARWHATRVTAALLSFCAVVLVIVGSFLPLYSGTLSFGGDDMEVTISPWSADVQGPTEPGDVPTVGYPLVFAAIVLACAAAISWYAATPAATKGVGRVAGLTSAIGGAFLIGTVWTTSLMVTNGVDSVLLLGTVLPGVETEATYLVGYWLLLVAALLGLGAAVLALIPVRQPTWAQANPDVSTPPYGIAPVALPAQPPGLFQVDPLTGHPLPSPPTGYPQPYAPQPPGWQPSPAQQPFQPPANQQSAMQSLAAQEPVARPQTGEALATEPAAAEVAQQQPFAEVPPPATGAPSAAGASIPRPAAEPQSASEASIPRPAAEPQPAAPPVAVKPPAAIRPPDDPATEQKP